MKQINNRIVVDLNKVQFAYLSWVADSFTCRYYRHSKPTIPTVNGIELEPDQKMFRSDESVYDCAVRRGLLDKWYPRLTLQLSSNHSLVYTGDKALELWKAWQAKIFGKKKS